MMMQFANWPDGRLLAAARDGDSDAFGVFFKRHGDAVARYLRRRTPSVDDAADLVAETFAAALVSVHSGAAESVQQGAPWLIGIARNKLIDSYRRGRLEAAARAELGLERNALTHQDQDRFGSSDLFGDVTRAFDELTQDDRQVLLERLVLERDYDEMASDRQQSEPGIRKQVSRALIRVRATMGARS